MCYSLCEALLEAALLFSPGLLLALSPAGLSDFVLSDFGLSVFEFSGVELSDFAFSGFEPSDFTWSSFWPDAPDGEITLPFFL